MINIWSMKLKINGIRIKDVAPFPDYVNFNVNKCLMTAEPEKGIGSRK